MGFRSRSLLASPSALHAWWTLSDFCVLKFKRELKSESRILPIIQIIVRYLNSFQQKKKHLMDAFRKTFLRRHFRRLVDWENYLTTYSKRILEGTKVVSSRCLAVQEVDLLFSPLSSLLEQARSSWKLCRTFPRGI